MVGRGWVGITGMLTGGVNFWDISVERDRIKAVSNVSAMDSLKYAMLCVKPYICFTIGIMSGY